MDFNIVAIGESHLVNTAVFGGNGTTLPTYKLVQLIRADGKTINHSNLGVGGQKSYQMVNGPNNNDPGYCLRTLSKVYIPSATKNLLLIFSGTNDSMQGVDIETNYQSIYNVAHSLGYTVMLMSIMSNTTNNTAVLSYNTLLRSHHTNYSDVFIDVWTIEPIFQQSPLNTTYWEPGGTHLVVAGNTLMSTTLYPFFQALY